MAREGVGAEERGLWRRWRALAAAGTAAAEPDALALAAYAEGRLDEDAAARTEAWLACFPEGFAELAAARAAAAAPAALAPERVLRRACALVGHKQAANDDAVAPPLRRILPRWRDALAWSSVAASIVAASLVGFSMGSSTYLGLSQSQSVDTAASDALVAPVSLESYFSDDSGT